MQRMPTSGAGLVLALDQGTTNSKALLVDAGTGVVLASGSHPVGITFPGPGAVEQDAGEIWNSTMRAAEECLAQVDHPEVAAVAVTNQRESVAAWDGHTGRALGPVLGWQDARTASVCAELRSAAGTVRSRTGLDLDPMFSAPKMRWLLDHVEHVADLRLGTLDTFLIDRLTGERASEAGNASRTLLLDLATQEWCPELLELFGIPERVLAPVVASDAVVGRTRPGLPVPAGTPVLAVLADSHASLYLHSGGRSGEGKATYGTGSSVMVVAETTTPPPGIASTLAWIAETPTFAYEGNVLASGAALTWLAGVLTDGDVAELGALAARVPDSGGVVFVPAFSGLGSPYFDRAATGLFAGLTGGAAAAHLARAAFDAVAHQVVDVVAAMEVGGAVQLTALHADGGATASHLLMQTQADLLGRDVQVTATAEASALGAALLAARALAGDEVADAWAALREKPSLFRPGLDGDSRATQRATWRAAVERSRGRALSPSATCDPAPATSTHPSLSEERP